MLRFEAEALRDPLSHRSLQMDMAAGTFITKGTRVCRIRDDLRRMRRTRVCRIRDDLQRMRRTRVCRIRDDLRRMRRTRVVGSGMTCGG